MIRRSRTVLLHRGGVSSWLGQGATVAAVFCMVVTVGWFLVLSSLASTAFAQVPTAQTPAPRLAVESAVYNFGVVRQGDQVKRAFTLKNTGNAELLIQRVVAACGCTATTPVKEKLAPGESTEIVVTFDTRGFSGEKLKTVRVFSNDPVQPSTVLTVQGTIQTDLVVEPPRLVFPDIMRGEARTGAAQEVSVRVRPGASVKLGNPLVSSRFVQVSEQPGATEKAKTLLVRISPDVSPGELRERIVLPLEGGGSSTLVIPVIATVRGTVEIRPVALSFGVLEGAAPIEKVARLENVSGGALSVVEVSADHPAVSAAARPSSGNTRPASGNRRSPFEIVVRVDPSKVSEDLKATVTVKTSRTSEPPLLLGVYGIRAR